jgi:hypothetical protein
MSHTFDKGEIWCVVCERRKRDVFYRALTEREATTYALQKTCLQGKKCAKRVCRDCSDALTRNVPDDGEQHWDVERQRKSLVATPIKRSLTFTTPSSSSSKRKRRTEAQILLEELEEYFPSTARVLFQDDMAVLEDPGPIDYKEKYMALLGKLGGLLKGNHLISRSQPVGTPLSTQEEALLGQFVRRHQQDCDGLVYLKVPTGGKPATFIKGVLSEKDTGDVSRQQVNKKVALIRDIIEFSSRGDDVKSFSILKDKLVKRFMPPNTYPIKVPPSRTPMRD